MDVLVVHLFFGTGLHCDCRYILIPVRTAEVCCVHVTVEVERDERNHLYGLVRSILEPHLEELLGLGEVCPGVAGHGILLKFKIYIKVIELNIGVGPELTGLGSYCNHLATLVESLRAEHILIFLKSFKGDCIDKDELHLVGILSGDNLIEIGKSLLFLTGRMIEANCSLVTTVLLEEGTVEHHRFTGRQYKRRFCKPF